MESKKLGSLNRTPKAMLALTCISLALSVLNGCRDGGGAPHSDYYFVLNPSSNHYWQLVKQGIEDAGTKAGITPTVVFADIANKSNSNWYPEIVADRPKIIVLGGFAPKDEAVRALAAQQAGIKLADINFQPGAASELKKNNTDLAFSFLADDADVGKRAAELISQSKKRPDPKVLVVGGPAANPCSISRINGFKDTLSKLVPQAQIVDSIYADWNKDRCQELTAKVLAKSPDVDYIFVISDGMALGAVEAVKKAGKSKHVSIISIDGIAEARKAIKDGLMTASLIQVPYWIGVQAFQKATEVTKGNSVTKQETVPILVITKDTLDANKDPLLPFIR